MRALVTGVAGFIGSTLAEALIGQGYRVLGIDCFTDYYSRKIKESNLVRLKGSAGFEFIEADLNDVDLEEILQGVDYVFHQAAQAGVRASWGEYFSTYTNNNVLATQKLLEAAKGSNLKKFVYASSSSVYGDAESYPTHELMRPQPISPYGVTKLAAEHLCQLYAKNFGVPTVSLRYFTVYGPRQRPDMAFHKFFKAILQNETVSIYGDGEQTRDFTYIDDIVRANILAAESEVVGEVFNIGGGSRVKINTVLEVIRDIVGKDFSVQYTEKQKGDVRHTAADISKAEKLLGYRPTVDLAEGLAREYEWIRKIY